MADIGRITDFVTFSVTSGTLTNAQRIGIYNKFYLVTGSGLTSTTMKFHVPDDAGTYVVAKDDSGTDISITISASARISCHAEKVAMILAASDAIKLSIDSSETATFELACSI